MSKQDKIVAKYAAFNKQNNDIFLCNSKTDLAKHIGSSKDTIRRRQLCNSIFIINDWCIHTNITVHKQPMRNYNW